MFMRIQRIGLIAGAAVLCAACTAPAAQQPTPQVQPAASTAAQPTANAETTAAPQPTASAEATAAPQPTAAPQATTAAEPQITQGETVLTLAIGSGSGQVGISGSGTDITGPRTFRIGSDGSIRLLDTLNKRILFFAKDGKLTRTFAIANVDRVIDFIVNNNGEIFVLAALPDDQTKVLHYNPAGTLVEQIAINDVVAQRADGIMLTAQGWILLVQGNTYSWVIRHNAVDTPPSLQALTERDAVPTPRSPVLFGTADAGGALEVQILAPINDALIQTNTLASQAPATTSFFNVDREMNLYSASDFSKGHVNFYRLATNGSVLGSVNISASGCAERTRSWRSYYIDQVGSAWSMCVTANQVTLNRYSLRDAQGQPLPEAAPTPADVAWKPGANFRAG